MGNKQSSGFKFKAGIPTLIERLHLRFTDSKEGAQFNLIFLGVKKAKKFDKQDALGML